MAPPVEIDQEILVLPSFTLECGETLKDVPIAYKTWGKLNERRDNVMIICHAFTGSSDVEDWCVLPFLRFSSSHHPFPFPYWFVVLLHGPRPKLPGSFLLRRTCFQSIGGAH